MLELNLFIYLPQILLSLKFDDSYPLDATYRSC